MKEKNLANKLKNVVGLNDTQVNQVLYCIKTHFEGRVPNYITERLDDVFEGNKIDISEVMKKEAGSFLNNMADKSEVVVGKVEEAFEKINDYLSSTKK